MRKKIYAAVFLCALAVLPISARKTTKPTTAVPPSGGAYDPARDPSKDLQKAIAEATRTHKRILLEVGGDWCMYCNMMDAIFADNPKLKQLRDSSYVNLRVNYSKENPNAEFLSHYPKIADYPHFFVLDSDGSFIHSQPTHPFEHGKTYNGEKIQTFLNKWSQAPRHWLNLQS